MDKVRKSIKEIDVLIALVHVIGNLVSQVVVGLMLGVVWTLVELAQGLIYFQKLNCKIDVSSMLWCTLVRYRCVGWYSGHVAVYIDIRHLCLHSHGA